MSKKHHQKHRLPPVKPAPPIAAEPPDIDNEAKLSPSEKAMLGETLANYGKAAGGGVTQLPAEFKPAIKAVIDNPKNEAIRPPYGPTVPNNGNVQNAGLHPVFDAKAAQKFGEEVAKVSSTALATSLGTSFVEVVIPDQDERLALASAFNQIANNVSVGAELFANLSQAEVSAVHLSYSQAVNNLLLTGAPSATPNPLDLRGLVALTLRGQEDKHNRRALLDLCARLDITAEELTLAQVKESLKGESWRLGDVAEEIPELEINPENEALWREYKVELGLIKRVGR